MENEKIICPFCGADITQEHSWKYSLLQEETTGRDLSFDSNWAGSYMKETKYTRQFVVYCCKHCYSEHEKLEQTINKLTNIALPFGFLVGFSYFIYRIIIENHSFSIWTILGPILYGIIGLFLFAIPLLLFMNICQKRTSYKHATKCNAIR